MVRIQGQSDYDKLDSLIKDLVAKHGLALDVTGWTRKTYDISRRQSRHDPGVPLARVESFATTNGEITVFDAAGMDFAQDLGAALEAQFEVGEAVIVQQSGPP